MKSKQIKPIGSGLLSLASAKPHGALLPPGLGAPVDYAEKYKIGKAIGKGKFSIVHKGMQSDTKQLIAIKKIGVFNIMCKKSRNKCLKEVRLLRSLDHPNIISYLDSFTTENELVIVFEWAGAGDLKGLIRRTRTKELKFAEESIWSYFSQICSAILYMHDQRVMHRDIKPANIFLMSNGTIKVGDLGLGRYLSEKTLVAFSKVGTPLYMSPEVIDAQGYDWKSDVWSLGCILYEFAVLKSPFKEEKLNLLGLCEKINEGKYPPIAHNYSAKLKDMVDNMIQVDPKNRPSMAAVSHDALAMHRKFQSQQNDTNSSAIMDWQPTLGHNIPTNLNANKCLSVQQSKVFANTTDQQPRSVFATNSNDIHNSENIGSQGNIAGGEANAESFRTSKERRNENGVLQENKNRLSSMNSVNQKVVRIVGGVATFVNRISKDTPKQDEVQPKNNRNKDILEYQVAVSQAEAIVEKLKLLNYEEQFSVSERITPTELVHVAKNSECSSAQRKFQLFMKISVWLMKQLGQQNFKELEVENFEASPVSQLEILMKMYWKKGMSNQVSLSRPELLRGWGASVCIMLDWLTAKVLDVKQVQLKQRSDVLYVDGTTNDVECFVEHKQVEWDSDDDDESFCVPLNDAAARATAVEKCDEIKKWELEVKNQAHKLSMFEAEFYSSSNNSAQGRLMLVREHYRSLCASPDPEPPSHKFATQGSMSPKKAKQLKAISRCRKLEHRVAENWEPPNRIELVQDQLRRLQANLSENLTFITIKETSLQQILDMKETHGNLVKQRTESISMLQHRTKQVLELQQEYQQVQSKWMESNSLVDQKQDAITNVKQVIQLRHTLKELKHELKEQQIAIESVRSELAGYQQVHKSQYIGN